MTLPADLLNLAVNLKAIPAMAELDFFSYFGYEVQGIFAPFSHSKNMVMMVVIVVECVCIT